MNLTAALENEYAEKAMRTWLFLTTINDCTPQPLLRVTTSKGFAIKQATIFTSPEDIRLKYLRVISSWITDY